MIWPQTRQHTGYNYMRQLHTDSHTAQFQPSALSKASWLCSASVKLLLVPWVTRSPHKTAGIIGIPKTFTREPIHVSTSDTGTLSTYQLINSAKKQATSFRALMVYSDLVDETRWWVQRPLQPELPCDPKSWSNCHIANAAFLFQNARAAEKGGLPEPEMHIWNTKITLQWTTLSHLLVFQKTP